MFKNQKSKITFFIKKLQEKIKLFHVSYHIQVDFFYNISTLHMFNWIALLFT